MNINIKETVFDVKQNNVETKKEKKISYQTILLHFCSFLNDFTCARWYCEKHYKNE